MADLPSLSRTRGNIKGSFTKYRNFINSATNTTSYESLKLRCDRLDALWEEFVLIDAKIMEFDNQTSEYSNQEDVFLDLKEKFLILMNQHAQPQVQSLPQLNVSTGVDDLNATLTRFAETQRSILEQQHSGDSRLPALNIPVFNGDYCKWPTFKDLFVNSVHTVGSISNSRKFQYLQMYLKGEAESLIAGMVCSNESYVEAWNKLKNIHEPTASAIRALSDNTDCILRGLKALGTDAEKRDPWIIYMLLRKLDDETKQQWSESSGGACDHPTIEQFLEFLNNRWSALESIQVYKNNLHSSTKNRCYVATETFPSNVKCGMCSGAHVIFKCYKFKNLHVNQKREFVKEKNLCFNCLSSEHRANDCASKQRCHCCGQLHHSCLHIDNNSGNDLNETSPPNPLSTFSIQTGPICQQVLLPTAIVNASHPYGKCVMPCKVLMDSASMGTFISENIVQRLRLPRRNNCIKVAGIGGVNFVYTRGIVSIRLTSKFDNNSSVVIEAHILKRISHEIQSKPLDLSQYHFPKDLNMADDGSLKHQEIDILIGSEYFFDFLLSSKVLSKFGFPTAQNTIFGYVLAGKIRNGGEGVCAYSTTINSCEFTLDETLRRFWEIEQEPQNTKNFYTAEEQFCEAHFQQTHTYDSSGRHVVRLPFRETSHEIGNSLKAAYNQFASLERRFSRDNTLFNQYNDFIKEYIALGHMEKIQPDDLNVDKKNCFYLPHHPVLKPESRSTKCRVVFNGSAKSSSGTSLNDIIAIGPIVQRDLTSLLINFRRYRIGLCGDIVKMYRQIKLHPNDRDFHRILWRDAPEQPISHYRLCTVTYGTGSAPFLATRCLRVSGEEAENQKIGLLIQNNFYVDDFIAGADSVEDALELKQQISETLQERGFPLTKWASNAKDIVQNSKHNPPDLDFANILAGDSLKILGLHWHPTTDCFTFHVSAIDIKCTKRTILSESAKIYDPLGFLSPCTVIIKIMFQQLWLHQFDWDEDLPVSVSHRWLKFRQEYTAFNNLQIPRWIQISSAVKLQLCGFSDASEMAYAAVVYCRTVTMSGIKVTLLTAKTKVAPLKQISLPRLELSGALLLAKLLKAIKFALDLTDVEIFTWTDSMIVLGWLSSPPRRWKTYVANRVSEIGDIVSRASWRHITSRDNPADVASRGLEPNELISCSLWWSGPKWLSEPQQNWPINASQINIKNEDFAEEERKNYCLSFPVTEQPDVIGLLLQRFSKFRKVIYIIAAWNRLILKRRNPTSNDSLPYTAAEINNALLHCIRWSQAQHYGEEIEQLKNKKLLAKRSSILKLSPFLDESLILRVGGRLRNSTCSMNTKHPIIISKDCIIAKRIISSEHLLNLHAGPTLLLNILRQRYWITNCRCLIKHEINNCVTCTRFRASTCSQQMSHLPYTRVTEARPFLRTGVDYAGPFQLRLHRGRNAKCTKGYIAVFTCLATRAIHLEVVSDLTSVAFLATLKRFVSRRGLPSDIHSDNGTNFIGASRELVRSFKQIAKNREIGAYIEQRQINWHLIPPGAPHFGGAWESAVKATKFHLRRVISDYRLTYEEFSTLLCEIEAQLNSRPLTKLYDDDIDNIDVLTPGHFLIGQPLVLVPEPNLESLKINRLSRWQLITRLQQDFWRRWQKEYLTTLQQRTKWCIEKENLKPGAVVLVYDEQAPPSSWQMGLVTDVHPGKDNLVRVVTVKTSSGIMKRPITKICKLPTDG